MQLASVKPCSQRISLICLLSRTAVALAAYLIISIIIPHHTAFSKITRMNNADYEVKLVDTAGQDEYSIFPAQYSMDFHGYVLVYSITSQKSFEVIKIIYEKLIDVMGKA